MTKLEETTKWKCDMVHFDLGPSPTNTDVAVSSIHTCCEFLQYKGKGVFNKYLGLFRH